MGTSDMKFTNAEPSLRKFVRATWTSLFWATDCRSSCRMCDGTTSWWATLEGMGDKGAEDELDDDGVAVEGVYVDELLYDGEMLQLDVGISSVDDDASVGSGGLWRKRQLRPRTSSIA